MKITNNARNGVLISIVILVVALTILLIVNSIPNVDINTLTETNKLKYNLGINKGDTPI